MDPKNEEEFNKWKDEERERRKVAQWNETGLVEKKYNCTESSSHRVVTSNYFYLRCLAACSALGGLLSVIAAVVVSSPVLATGGIMLSSLAVLFNYTAQRLRRNVEEGSNDEPNASEASQIPQTSQTPS